MVIVIKIPYDRKTINEYHDKPFKKPNDEMNKFIKRLLTFNVEFNEKSRNICK